MGQQSGIVGDISLLPLPSFSGARLYNSFPNLKISLSLSLSHTHTHTHTPPHVPSAAALGVLEPRTTFVPASPAPKATCSLCCNEPLGLNSPLCWTELRTSDASEPRGMETMTLEYYLTIKENAVPVHAEYPRTLRALCQVEETRHNRPHIV